MDAAEDVVEGALMRVHYATQSDPICGKRSILPLAVTARTEAVTCLRCLAKLRKTKEGK